MSRKKSSRTIEQSFPELSEKYSFWENAVPQGLLAMQYLIDYTHSRKCNENDRVQVNALKLQFIKLLYENNFCETAVLNTEVLNEARGKKTTQIDYVFSFAHRGQKYRWTLPMDWVNFEVKISQYVENFLPPQDVLSDEDYHPDYVTDDKIFIKFILAKGQERRELARESKTPAVNKVNTPSITKAISPKTKPVRKVLF